jgi:hypothetical protein
MRLDQEALGTGELVLLNWQNHDLKLFVDYVWNRKAVRIVGIVVPKRRLRWDSLFQRIQ